MSDVFISYSRLDKEFVDKLHEFFTQQNLDVWIDWEDIPPSQAWWERIKDGIETANNILVVISPNSMASPICQLEIEFARQKGKRVIPIFLNPANKEECIQQIQARLERPNENITRIIWENRSIEGLFTENETHLTAINYFFFKPEDDFNQRLFILLDIIKTDFNHKEKHTRIGLRANQWASRDRDISFLLIGQELKDAEIWAREAVDKQKDPAPTDEQRAYIRASEQRRLYTRSAILTTSLILVISIGFAIIIFVRSQEAQANLDNANIQLATVTQDLSTATAVAQNLSDAEATLEVVNQQVIVAQATVTQAAVVQDIANSFAEAMLQNRDNPDLQIAQMNELLTRYPNEAQAYFSHGLVYAEARHYEEAIADYDEALRLNPQYALAYNNRGFAYSALGEYERAIADYDEALRLNPQYANGYYNRGTAYVNLGEYVRAIADYDEAIRLNPDLVVAYNNRGLAYADLGEYEKAIVDYDEAIQRNPQYALAYNNRGSAYKNLGEYEKAIADYDEALRLNPQSAEAYTGRGNVYVNLGKYGQAMDDYDEALRLNPQYALAYNNRGLAYDNLGEYEKAIADFDEAIRLNPEYAEPYNNRGNAYQNLGDDEQAITDYDEAIRLNPEYAEPYNNRGNAYQNLGDDEQAITDYDEAIRLNPKLAEAYYNRGNAYFDLGEYEKAIANYEEAIRLNPKLAEAYYNRGLAYYFMALDETDDALKRTYAQDAIDDFRMAEQLGIQLNNAVLDAILEAILAEPTPTP